VKFRPEDFLDILKRFIANDPGQEEKEAGKKERDKEFHGRKGLVVSVGEM